jgi:hypothetical protein
MGVGGYVNKAIKTDINNNKRRIKLVWHFSQFTKPDARIQSWIDEYDEILESHEDILQNKKVLDHGIIRVSVIGRKIDMTTLQDRLYLDGAKITVIETNGFVSSVDSAPKRVIISTEMNNLDLRACIKRRVPSAAGSAKRVIISSDLEQRALDAIRNELIAKDKWKHRHKRRPFGYYR